MKTHVPPGAMDVVGVTILNASVYSVQIRAGALDEMRICPGTDLPRRWPERMSVTPPMPAEASLLSLAGGSSALCTLLPGPAEREAWHIDASRASPGEFELSAGQRSAVLCPHRHHLPADRPLC